MTGMAWWLRLASACLLPWLSTPLLAEDGALLLRDGAALRRSGEVSRAVALLEQAQRTAVDEGQRAWALFEYGAALRQAGRGADAAAALTQAQRLGDPTVRARAALELGHLARQRRLTNEAAEHYARAAALAGPDFATALAARLAMAQIAGATLDRSLLDHLAQDIDQLPSGPGRAGLRLALGELARGARLTGLAHGSLSRALDEAGTERRLRLELLDVLAQLYEDEQRWDDVVTLAAKARTVAETQASTLDRDLLLAIEWRLARAQRQLDRSDLALAALTRAVEHAEAVRQDLPLETADGTSTYTTTLHPLLEQFAAAQLQRALSLAPPLRERALGRVRDAIEAMRQAEMQDFLGDRCMVDEGGGAVIDPGTVVLYPLLLADRVELLVETASGLRHYHSPVGRERIDAVARIFAADLRAGEPGYAQGARLLYDWLLRPVAAELEAAETLVVVADGALRLIPFAALRDERGFVVERLAVATATGLSMTALQTTPGGSRRSLLAGVAEPGPVVAKLDAGALLDPLASARGAPGGAMARGRALRAAPDHKPRREDLGRSLALPGVREEIGGIARTLPGRTLLDAAFTVDSFHDEAETGAYRVVHIASHGVFGGTAESSFILAYDDLLGINRLQSVLRSERIRQHPIELLTLSACSTAEGNERAPLGIAGAAIRARAQSVLGTLWPVEDGAARLAMETFYRQLAVAAGGKAAALRAAQLALLGQPGYQHPFFWAPFSLVGNWK